MHSTLSFLTTILAVFAIAFFAMPIQAKVAPAPIEDLIRQSQLIVVGKVKSVSKIERVDFANVEILQTLKGNSFKNIYYSAERTWTCDMSTAVDGETALFFFDKYKIEPNLNNANQPPNPFRMPKTDSFKETVERLISDSELFRLSFDGRGRMPIEETISEKKLQISSGVILPKDLKPELSEIINYTNKVLSSE